MQEIDWNFGNWYEFPTLKIVKLDYDLNSEKNRFNSRLRIKNFDLDSKKIDLNIDLGSEKI